MNPGVGAHGSRMGTFHFSLCTIPCQQQPPYLARPSAHRVHTAAGIRCGQEQLVARWRTETRAARSCMSYMTHRRETLVLSAVCVACITRAGTLKQARCRGAHLVPVVVQAAQRDDRQRALAGRAADAALAQQPHRVPPVKGRPAARAPESHSRKRSGLKDLCLLKHPPHLYALAQAGGSHTLWRTDFPR